MFKISSHTLQSLSEVIMSDDPPHKDVQWWWWWWEVGRDISQSFCQKLSPRNSAHRQFRQSDSGSLPRISAETTVVTNFISAGSEHLTGRSYTVIYHREGGHKNWIVGDSGGQQFFDQIQHASVYINIIKEYLLFIFSLLI